MKGNLTELGRSMVEMLGVLAVIGVLSIVGLQGYKKAMNKIKANELMDIAIKLHNENMARGTANPALTASSQTGCLCSNDLPSGSTTSSENYISTWCNGSNLAWQKPSWAKLASFSVRSSIYVSVNSAGTAKYNTLNFYGVGDCAICDEIANMTNILPGTTTRQLPGSVTEELNGGTYVSCHKGSDTSATADKCF